MTKYVANAMLATKISFMNEIANICERIGANVQSVRLGIGSDKRIGYKFIYAGCGYGGSCFPKDVKGLINTSIDVGYTPQLLSKVDEVNEDQKQVLVNKVVNRFGDDLSGFTFSIWGLAFKPQTDDVRCAPSITVISEEVLNYRHMIQKLLKLLKENLMMILYCSHLQNMMLWMMLMH